MQAWFDGRYTHINASAIVSILQQGKLRHGDLSNLPKIAQQASARVRAQALVCLVQSLPRKALLMSIFMLCSPVVFKLFIMHMYHFKMSKTII